MGAGQPGGGGAAGDGPFRPQRHPAGAPPRRRRRGGGARPANAGDPGPGRRAGPSEAVLDRLLLTRERLEGIAADVRQVSLLPDPIGEVFDMRTLPNGLQVGRKRVPLGVIAAVYESRPNVTVG